MEKIKQMFLSDDVEMKLLALEILKSNYKYAYKKLFSYEEHFEDWRRVNIIFKERHYASQLHTSWFENGFYQKSFLEVCIDKAMEDSK